MIALISSLNKTLIGDILMKNCLIATLTFLFVLNAKANLSFHPHSLYELNSDQTYTRIYEGRDPKGNEWSRALYIELNDKFGKIIPNKKIYLDKKLRGLEAIVHKSNDKIVVRLHKGYATIDSLSGNLINFIPVSDYSQNMMTFKISENAERLYHLSENSIGIIDTRSGKASLNATPGILKNIFAEEQKISVVTYNKDSIIVLVSPNRKNRTNQVPTIYEINFAYPVSVTSLGEVPALEIPEDPSTSGRIFYNKIIHRFLRITPSKFLVAQFAAGYNAIQCTKYPTKVFELKFNQRKPNVKELMNIPRFGAIHNMAFNKSKNQAVLFGEFNVYNHCAVGGNILDKQRENVIIDLRSSTYKKGAGEIGQSYSSKVFKYFNKGSLVKNGRNILNMGYSVEDVNSDGYSSPYSQIPYFRTEIFDPQTDEFKFLDD
jgi:hypothetical protein